jgi:hypothetical protein
MYLHRELHLYLGICDIALGSMILPWDPFSVESMTCIGICVSALGYMYIHWDMCHYIGICGNALDNVTGTPHHHMFLLEHL